ncbi:MAG: glycosyltransferase [Fimbriimonadales bacterium]|nr:glycosyltransferase [Fimbriimonadales bacterium]MDW8052147.1 glycosyltransferase [Armatimonadota bacterium]
MKNGRIRVVQVIPAFNVGGAEWMATYLAAHLDPERFESHLISLHPPKGSPLEQYLQRHGAKIHSAYKRRGFDGRTYLRLIRLLRQIRPDIVHTHQPVGRYVYPACLFARPKAVVHTVHNVALGEIRSRLWRRFQSWAYRFGVQPVSIAEEVSRTFRREYRREPVALIPNGIPTARYMPNDAARAVWRAREGIPQDAVLLVCVGALRAQKNHPLLLRAYARLGEQSANTLLLVVGAPDHANPTYADSLQRLAQELGIAERVRFLGGRGDVPAILNASDIFVLASHYEGNPLSVMEAMAAGLPPVCTAVGGVPELIQHERTGLLVPPENEAALADALKRLIKDASLRHQLGAAAREYACTHFDIKTMVQAYEQLYLQLLRQEREPHSSNDVPKTR